MRVSILLGVASLSAACIGTTQRSHQLYEDSGEAVNGVAKLVGDVATVDGKAVADMGHSFELPAKCHVVTNVTEWGGFDASQAMMAKLPSLSFALNMKGDHTYVVRIRRSADTQLVIEALEQDESGEITQRFEPGGSCP